MLPASEGPQSAVHLLNRLDWQVVRRLDGLLQGDYRTLLYGNGIDFADLRDYQPQDDIRHIDWNVTARMNTPFVRQYIEDREITAWFLLDLTPSMRFGRLDQPKEKILVDFVAVMARILTRSGNRVGAIVYDGNDAPPLAPRSGKNQVLRLIRELQKQRLPSGRATELTHLLNQGLTTITRRSLIFIISDFISESGWEKPLSLLNRRHECLAIRLWDPFEIELPDMGMIVAEDAETSEQLVINTSNPEFRRRFEAAAEQRETNFKESARRAGVDLFGISTDEDVVEAIIRMARLRRKKRR